MGILLDQKWHARGEFVLIAGEVPPHFLCRIGRREVDQDARQFTGTKMPEIEKLVRRGAARLVTETMYDLVKDAKVLRRIDPCEIGRCPAYARTFYKMRHDGDSI